MTEKEYVLETMRSTGTAAAQRVQEQAPELTGTELYAREGYIPDFAAACARKNMLERTAGFVCRSAAGRVVRLLQPYDSTIYTQEPEELPAQPRDDETPPPQDGEGPNEKPEQDRP